MPPDGSVVEFKCVGEDCGWDHKLTWTGKMWKVLTPGHEFAPPVEEHPSDDIKKLAEEGVEALRRKQDEPEGGAFQSTSDQFHPLTD